MLKSWALLYTLYVSEALPKLIFKKKENTSDKLFISGEVVRKISLKKKKKTDLTAKTLDIDPSIWRLRFRFRAPKTNHAYPENEIGHCRIFVMSIKNPFSTVIIDEGGQLRTRRIKNALIGH